MVETPFSSDWTLLANEPRFANGRTNVIAAVVNGFPTELWTLRRVATLRVYHGVHDSVDDVAVFAADVDLTDGDIVCGEGRRMVFLDPDAALALDLARGAQQVIPVVLGR